MMVANSCKVKQRHFLDEQPPAVREFTSIAVYDTEIVTPKIVFDTIFKFLPNDTVFITDSITRVKLKVVKLPGDSIYIQPECPSDTITIKQYRIEKVKESILDNPNNVKKTILFIILGIFALFAIGYTVNAIKR
jgi:hypothetical protein